MRSFTAGFLLAAAAFASAAWAASSYFPEFYHSYNPVAGGWSTYRIKDSLGATSELTFAVVAREGESLWLEVRTAEQGVETVAAFLVKGDPTEDANVLMIRVKDGDGPAVEIGQSALDRLKRAGKEAFGGGRAVPIGPTMGKLQSLPGETLAVGKKRLQCRHMKVLGAEDQSAEVWLHKDVAPFGIVKLSSGGEEVTLLDFGSGAKPKIRGPFIPIEIP